MKESKVNVIEQNYIKLLRNKDYYIIVDSDGDQGVLYYGNSFVISFIDGKFNMGIIYKSNLFKTEIYSENWVTITLS